MNNTNNNKYDYYFALGYETVEQIDLFLKNNITITDDSETVIRHNNSKPKSEEKFTEVRMPSSLISSQIETLHNPENTSSAGGIHFTELPGTPPEILIVNLPTSATRFNKFQIDFNLKTDASLGTINPYNPEEIDIAVKFITYDTVSSRWITLLVNAYYGKEYNRNLCSNTLLYPDPTIYPPKYAGVTNMLPCSYANLFNGQSINYNTPDGDPGYLQLDTTKPVWHARFAPPYTGDWEYSFRVNFGGVTYILPGGSFHVGKSHNPGYVGATGRNFRLSQSLDIFLPFGCNSAYPSVLAFNRAPYVMHTTVIDALKANKGNYIRLFITYDKLGFERGDPDGSHPDWVVGNYDYGQDRAFDLDGIIEYAEQNGVYVQLVLEEQLYFRPDYVNCCGYQTQTYRVNNV